MAELWVWGINQSYGQLGDNTTTNRSSPVQTITGGTNWSVVSFGKNHSAAIKSDGTLWVWGLNNYGQLGDNTIVNKSSPIQTISAGSDWSTVCCGQFHTVALKTDGTLWSWGAGNFSGASGILGDNNSFNRSSPVQTISAGTDWASISCSDKNTAAIKKDGSLWIWGGNGYGQLGTNTSVLRVSSPIQTVAGGTNWSKISVGYGHISAIKSDGTLWLWGRNNIGQLGNNDIIDVSSPIQTITYGNNWSEISSFQSNQAAIKTDGTLWLWGNAFNGQLGDNTNVNKSSPVQTISAGTNWSKVQIGASASFSIKKDGTLWSWGVNSFGTLGDNTNVQKSSPVQVFGSINNWQNLATRVDRAAAALYEPPVPYIVLQTSPQYFYNAQPFGVQPVINFYDASNNLLTSGTYAVSASAVSGTLSLGGTTTANSSGGVAAFSNLSFTGTGTGSLLFAASGFTSIINGPLSVVPPVPVMPIRTETSGKIPTSGQLFIGELAINITDQKGYVKKSDGTIVNVFTGLYSGVIQNYMIASGAIIPDGGTF